MLVGFDSQDRINPTGHIEAQAGMMTCIDGSFDTPF